MYELEMVDGVAVLTPTRRLEGLGRVAARRQVDELLESGCTRFVIDLSRLGFIDSSGLGSLVVTFHRARQAGGQMVLCGLSTSIRSVFEATRLDGLIPICTDRVEALARVSV